MNHTTPGSNDFECAYPDIATARLRHHGETNIMNFFSHKSNTMLKCATHASTHTPAKPGKIGKQGQMDHLAQKKPFAQGTVRRHAVRQRVLASCVSKRPMRKVEVHSAHTQRVTHEECALKSACPLLALKECMLLACLRWGCTVHICKECVHIASPRDPCVKWRCTVHTHEE